MLLCVNVSFVVLVFGVISSFQTRCPNRSNWILLQESLAPFSTQDDPCHFTKPFIDCCLSLLTGTQWERLSLPLRAHFYEWGWLSLKFLRVKEGREGGKQGQNIWMKRRKVGKRPRWRGQEISPALLHFSLSLDKQFYSARLRLWSGEMRICETCSLLWPCVVTSKLKWWNDWNVTWVVRGKVF